MKKYLSLTLMVMVSMMLVFTSCKKDDPDPDPTPNPNPNPNPTPTATYKVEFGTGTSLAETWEAKPETILGQVYASSNGISMWAAKETAMTVPAIEMFYPNSVTTVSTTFEDNTYEVNYYREYVFSDGETFQYADWSYTEGTFKITAVDITNSTISGTFEGTVDNFWAVYFGYHETDQEMPIKITMTNIKFNPFPSAKNMQMNRPNKKDFKPEVEKVQARKVLRTL